MFLSEGGTKETNWSEDTAVADNIALHIALYFILNIIIYGENLEAQSNT